MSSYVIEQKDDKDLVELTANLTAGMAPDLQAGLKSARDRGTTDLPFVLENMMLDSIGIVPLIAANLLARTVRPSRAINKSPDILRLPQFIRLAGWLNVSGSISKENCNG
jgi:hypothetical protein